MTDIEMLPLPEPSDKLYKPETLTSHGYVTYRHTTQQVKAYARAVAEHNVNRERERAERLAEALRWYVENDDTNEGQEGNEYWLAGRDRAIAVLRDHDQEVGNG